MSSLPELFRLDGRVAVIVGGARDLGMDMASALAEAGAMLAVTSRDIERAKAAAGWLKDKYNVDTLGLGLDQRDYAQVVAAAEKVRQWKGKVDILINNAGGGSGAGPGHLFERDPQDVVDLITVNLIGALHCCQVFGKIMAEQGHGKIINIGSIAGLVGRDRRMYQRSGMKGQPIDYAAAKAGVIGMTRDLAGLLSPMGVHVNCISPGGFARGNLPEGFVADYSDVTPMGRMGRDGIDLKGAALFLSSSASDYITGHNLVVDGGFSIWK